MNGGVYFMKSRITILSSIIALALALVTISCYLVVQNVGSVHQIFFPMVTAVVDSADSMEEWERISFNDKNDLTFDSIFWDKEITIHANSGSYILLRVKDVNGDLVVDEFQVSPGNSAKLDWLKNDEKYFFEIKATKGKFFINAT
ncbi:hypothetical protein PB01_14565 [Psychrobacillus glaciei]|uniref:Uncharacterized protein n=2 Tax=Psychrobacillus glaciei TaxID=2283160 RepID=A0A5J6SPM7_9BACI|nr:hypothetical protein PB01_14565 [Psychrobacillus glaciei]